jgi:Caspase domain
VKNPWLGMLILALLAWPISARRHALLIGNNFGGVGVDSLRYSESDVRRFAEVLTRIAGFSSEDIQVLVNCDSLGLENGLKNMRKRLTRNKSAPAIAEGSGDQDLFLFYYSGHSDRDALRLGSTRYPLEKLKSGFQEVPSQVKIGIFDACQSGMMTRFKGGTTSKPLSLESLKNVYGQVIIASSAMDERSQESDQLEGSVFTHHWLNGMRGSADMSGDRKVTLNEAYQYAYQMTIETTSRSRSGIQHPAYQFRIYGEGDIVLADLNQGRSGLAFGFRQDGKYLVVDKERGRILADFYKSPDRELLVSLPEGNYNVLKVEKDQWRVAEVAVATGRVSDFNPIALKKQAQVVNQVKGGLSAGYEITPGPPRAHFPAGPSRKWGLSYKVGESAGLLGISLLHNIQPELQLQFGAGFPSSMLELPIDSQSVNNTAFLLIRKYQGVYFFDTGLNIRTASLEISDASGTVSKTKWDLGIPVHFGIEIGPRRSVFGTLSIGYLWMVTGGGHPVYLRTPAGKSSLAHTTESGLSLGIAMGMYLF